MFVLYMIRIQGRTCLFFTGLGYTEGRACSLHDWDTRKDVFVLYMIRIHGRTCLFFTGLGYTEGCVCSLHG